MALSDRDVTNIPQILADPYGNYIPGPARGLPQYVTATGLVEGNIASPVPVPANVLHFDTPFLTDIAHNADPEPAGHRQQPGHAAGHPDAGHRHRPVRRLRGAAARHVRRRDAERAFRLR